MTGKERFCRALAGMPVDRVPRWDLEFHLFDALGPAPLVLGYAFAALDAAAQERALRQNAETMITVCREIGADALTAPNGYWETAPGHPAYYWLPDGARQRQVTVLRELAGDELALVYGASSTVMPPLSDAYAQFCYQLYDAPEEVDAAARQTLASGLAAARAARDLGVDAVLNACDIADNHGVFFSPPQLARFWMPYLCEWAAAMRELGVYAILHSDGNLTDILDQLADSGLHGLQAIDPIAGMDIAATAARVGDRLTLCGNIDCGLLLTGTPEEVYRVTRATVLACRERRFVLGSSNAVQQEVPVENYRALIAAWQACVDAPAVPRD